MFVVYVPTSAGQVQDGGAVYVSVAVHEGSAEKLAVIVQLVPFAFNPVKLIFWDDPNGALKVWVPPHEFVSVSVPVVGGSV